MSVTYESAMSTLTSMFGDVDKEVIAMILQANGGHMEKTVENLLAMSSGGGAGGAPPRRAPPQQQQPSPARAQPLPQMMHSPYQSPYPQHPGMHQYQQYPPAHPMQQQPPPPYGQPQIINNYIPAGPQPQQPYSPQQPSPQAYRRVEEHKQGPPPAHPSHAPPSAVAPRPAPAPQADLMIPDDFMRPPSFFQAIMMGVPIRQPMPQQQQQPVEQYSPADIAHASPASAASQIEQDHLLAQMLQDEQFMQDLANHPERYRNVAAQQQQQPQQQQLAAPGPAAASASPVRPQPAPIADAKLSAPPAHPHPELVGGGDAHARSASGGNQSGPVWTPPPAAGAAVALGSEPLNPRLQQLEHGGPSAVTKEQQSSFAKRWSSLTSAAREKLSRISERFKKDPAHDADMDGGGAYKSMPLSDGPEEQDAHSQQQRRPLKLNDIRFAEANDEPDPSANANFLSAEEAASMQASYRTPAAAGKSKGGKKKNALLVDDDEADPFGSGANGSGDDDDDDDSNPNARFKYLQRNNSIDSVSQASSSGVSVLPQMSRTLSGLEANNAEYDEDQQDDAEGDSEGYKPPRMPVSNLKPERIILSPSQFQHGGGAGGAAASSSSSSSAQKHARKGSAAAPLVDPPSDDEDKPSLPAQRKRSSVSGAAPGRVESKPLLQDVQDM